MQNKRPVIDLPYTALERAADIIALVVIIFMLFYVRTNYPGLPEQIPVHFGADGQPDSWGNKSSLLVLSLLTLVLYAGLKVLEKFPHYYNYLTTITEANAAFQYLNARKMIGFLKTEIVLVFAYIQWGTIAVVKGSITGMGFWFLPVFLLVLFGTTGFYMLQMLKKTDKDRS